MLTCFKDPPKVPIVLEELGIPYETVPVEISKTKEPEFLKVNPNGRIPAIYDPNTDLTLWESGAIILYLIERYDKKQALSFPAGSNDAALALQYLFFQVSGQGPYYGQVRFSRIRDCSQDEPQLTAPFRTCGSTSSTPRTCRL